MRQTRILNQRRFDNAFATATAIYARARRGAHALFAHQPMLILCVALAMLALSALWLARERAFPYWDIAYYQDQSFLVADAFRTSFHEGFSVVMGSLNDDYNKLLTLPLAPLLLVLGESRMVYVWDLIIVFLVPLLIVMAVLARRLFPNRADEAAAVAVMMTVATPLAWRNILEGYADISGAVMIGAMLLLYDRTEHGLRWRPMLACGACAAFAVLLRRHFVYADVAFYLAFFFDIIVTAARERWAVPRTVRAFVTLFGSGVVLSVMLWALAPGFIQRVANPNYGHYFVPWQASAEAVSRALLSTAGAWNIVLAAAGFVALGRISAARRSLARVIIVGTVVWSLIWVGWVRQAPTHYPHAFPFFLVIGLTSLWLYVRQLVAPVARIGLSWGIGMILVVEMLAAFPLNQALIGLSKSLPEYAAPVGETPLVNPAYDEIVRLVYYLRMQADPHDHIIVAASSQDMNFDLLHEAEVSIFGPSRAILHIDGTPQVDAAGDAPPAEALIHANYVLVAEPFQHHLAADQQKEVHVLVDVFAQRWKIAQDFKPLSERFLLEPGVSMVIYKRTRPTSIGIALDTQTRMARYMQQAAMPASAVGSGWVQISSPYAVSATLNGDGSSSITGNPAREDQEPKTILVHPEPQSDDVQISGYGKVTDARCAGARVVFGTEYHGPQRTLAATLTPNEAAQRFDVLVRHARGNLIYLELDHAAASPDKVDYCSVSLQGIRVVKTGRALLPRVAASLRSDANPFTSAPASRDAASPSPSSRAEPVAWVRRSSPFPSDVTESQSGTASFSGHPTRVGQEPDTVIEFGPTNLMSVRLSGLVRFYAHQCKGAQIVAGTNYGSTDRTTVIGVFTPNGDGTPFNAVISGTKGKTIYLKFKSNPATPQDIDFCTMRVEGLKVEPA